MRWRSVSGMGRRVIVTAAAAGIGQAIAEAFLGNGDLVEICDVDATALDAFRAAHPAVVASRVDLSDGDAIDAWLDAALERLGGVDVLVNNAGVKGPTAFVEDVEPDEWTATMAVCLDSHYRCVRRVAPVLKAQGAGTVINLSSTAGLFGYGMRTPTPRRSGRSSDSPSRSPSSSARIGSRATASVPGRRRARGCSR